MISCGVGALDNPAEVRRGKVVGTLNGREQLGVTADCRKRVAPEFSPFQIFPFLREVFVPGTSRAVQTHFVPSWYKEKWKKRKGENSGVTRFVQSAVVDMDSAPAGDWWGSTCRGRTWCSIKSQSERFWSESFTTEIPLGLRENPQSLGSGRLNVLNRKTAQLDTWTKSKKLNDLIN